MWPYVLLRPLFELNITAFDAINLSIDYVLFGDFCEIFFREFGKRFVSLSGNLQICILRLPHPKLQLSPLSSSAKMPRM